tara:strand:- start:40 stop:696 length:657 start_codon:yes stop_codon:yes gene_type:complete
MPKLRIKSWKECVMDKAVSPIKFGKPLKRKCLCIGQNYYWKNIATDNWDNHPLVRQEIIDRMGIDPTDEGVSCLINVYGEKDANIGFHIDKPDDLYGNNYGVGSSVCDVYSMSFAIDENKLKRESSGRYEKLGDMTYKYENARCNDALYEYWTPQSISAGGTKKKPICNGMVISWNGVYHSREKISHKARTLIPRINITVRLHKNFKNTLDASWAVFE